MEQKIIRNYYHFPECVSSLQRELAAMEDVQVRCLNKNKVSIAIYASKRLILTYCIKLF